MSLGGTRFDRTPREGLIIAALLLAGAGCNTLTGFDGLEKADCAGDGCTGGGGGGTSTGGSGGSGGNGGGAGASGPSDLFTMNTGRHGSCAVTAEGEAWCWGKHTGNADNPTSPLPQRVDGPAFFAIGSGLDHFCGLTQDGQLLCWGDNDEGQLGNGTKVSSQTPVEVLGLPLIDRFSLAGTHNCVTTPLGGGPPQVFCWGGNAYGQLGLGDTMDRDTPVEVTGLGDVIRVSCGQGYTCAVRADGTLLCWGLNDRGQLGLDPAVTPMVSTPTVVMGMPALERVYPSVKHTCGRTDGVKEMVCWGANDHGQLGDGTTDSRFAPALVPGVSNLSVGYPGARHTCAADGNLDVFCWGANDHGQLGKEATMLPQTLAELLVSNIATIASKGSEHTCYSPSAESANLQCMGLNDSGQLGDGTFESRDAPTPVAF